MANAVGITNRLAGDSKCLAGKGAGGQLTDWANHTDERYLNLLPIIYTLCAQLSSCKNMAIPVLVCEIHLSTVSEWWHWLCVEPLMVLHNAICCQTTTLSYKRHNSNNNILQLWCTAALTHHVESDKQRAWCGRHWVAVEIQWFCVGHFASVPLRRSYNES